MVGLGRVWWRSMALVLLRREEGEGGTRVEALLGSLSLAGGCLPSVPPPVAMITGTIGVCVAACH